jgi:hypothetical protein
VRRDQVLGIAVTDAMLRARLASRRWQAVLPSIYACFDGQLTNEQREIAAWMYAGQGAQLTGPAALRWYGLRYAPTDLRVHVLVSHRRHVSSRDFVVIRRTNRLDVDTVARPPLVVTSLARAVIESGLLPRDGSAATLANVRSMAAEVVQRRLATTDQLAFELDRAPRRGSQLIRRAIADLDGGARSAPEAELRDLFDGSSVIPTIHWNARLLSHDSTNLPTPDGWIDDVGIALEVDSKAHHLALPDWEETMRRNNLLTSRGAVVLHFPPSQIRGAPESVVRTVVEAYLERARTGAKAAIRIAP